MKHLSSALILILLAYSCSQEEMETGGETCMVTFTSAMLDATVTKSASPLAEGSDVMVSAYSLSSGEESTSCSQSKLFTISDAAGSMTPANGSNMLVFGSASYMFYAFNPALPFDEGSQKTLSIDQGTDFKIASVQAAIEGGTTTVTLPAMTRKCCYTEFAVNLDLTNAKNITSVAIGDNGFTMNGITHSPVSYTLGNGDIQLSDVALDGSRNIAQSDFTTVTTGSAYVGGTPVLPKAGNSFTMDFDLYLNSVRTTATATIPAMEFVPGIYYKFSVNVWDTKVGLTLLVAPWTNVASSDPVGNWIWNATTGEWIYTDGTSPDLGDGDLGVITIGEWTISAATSTGAVGTDQSPTLLIDGWAPVGTDTGETGIDQSPTISIGNWTANPSFSDDLGTNLSDIGIAGWTQSSSGNTDMGGE